MEIDEPFPLNSKTGAIALLVTDIHHRENFPDSTFYPDIDPDVSSRPSTPYFRPPSKNKRM